MGGLFDDSLDDDDYVDEYDDEDLEDSEDELGVDYHEIRNPEDSISRAPGTEYNHPELTPPGGSGGSNKPYSSIAQAAIAQTAAHKKKHRKAKPGHIKKNKVKISALHKHKHGSKPGHVRKTHVKIKVKKLPLKLKHKHGIKHVVLRHHSGKRTVFV